MRSERSAGAGETPPLPAPMSPGRGAGRRCGAWRGGEARPAVPPALRGGTPSGPQGPCAAGPRGAARGLREHHLAAAAASFCHKTGVFNVSDPTNARV